MRERPRSRCTKRERVANPLSSSMMSLVDLFRERLTALELETGPALVAVSGGRDSVVLLDLLVATQEDHGLKLMVAHVDHGITHESAEVAEQVRALATEYGLPFFQTRCQLGPDATETEARSRRYAWLEGRRQALGAAVILLAHHADDQAETVLMRALSGSGPAGLAGMAPRQGPLVRPLLGFGRQELEQYAVERGLSWWDDPANADPRHFRSWVREELLPRLRARIPDIEPRLLKLGDQARADRGAWNALLDVLPELDCRLEPDGCSVAAPVLARYDSGLAATVLQALARRAGCVLGRTRAERVLRMAQRGMSGRTVELGGRWRAELAFGRLRIFSQVAQPVPHMIPVPLPRHGDVEWGSWSIRWQPEPAPAAQQRKARSAWFPPEELVLRAARSGERMRPLGGVGSRSLGRCFQEARVPKSWRAGWPVFASEGEVVWIPGVCRSGVLVPEAGTEAVRVDVNHK